MRACSRDAGMWELASGQRGAAVDLTLRVALDETEMILYDAVGSLLAATGTDPSEVRP